VNKPAYENLSDEVRANIERLHEARADAAETILRSKRAATDWERRFGSVLRRRDSEREIEYTPRARRLSRRHFAGEPEPEYRCERVVRGERREPYCDGPNVQHYHVRWPESAGGNGEEFDRWLCSEHVAEGRSLGFEISPISKSGASDNEYRE
jgi:hypothetical protein